MARKVSAHPADVQIWKIEILFKIELLFKNNWTYLKEQRKGFHECLKIMHIIKTRSDLDILEQGHPKDTEDEHDQE